MLIRKYVGTDERVMLKKIRVELLRFRQSPFLFEDPSQVV